MSLALEAKVAALQGEVAAMKAEINGFRSLLRDFGEAPLKVDVPPLPASLRRMGYQVRHDESRRRANNG